MRILACRTRKIEANKKEVLPDKLTISQTQKITDLRTRRLESINQNGLEVDFEYTFSYQTPDKKKDLASITIGGAVLSVLDKGEDGNDIVEKWKKSKSVEPKLFVPIINNVIRHSVTRAMHMAEELDLPPPIRIPRLKQATQEAESSRYIG